MSKRKSKKAGRRHDRIEDDQLSVRRGPMADAPARPGAAAGTGLYLNRELSWIEFNARVLHEAFDPRNPLLERLKFLAIFSTNLDEFYMVRVAGLRRQVAAGVTAEPPCGLTPQQQLEAIVSRVAALTEGARSLLHETLLPALAERG